MKKIKNIFKRIKDKIDTYIQTNRILKSQIKTKNETIETQALDTHNLLEELREYRSKCNTLGKEKQEMKQQLRDLTKRDKKLKQIEELFEGKNVKLRDITKILEGDE